MWQFPELSFAQRSRACAQSVIGDRQQQSGRRNLSKRFLTRQVAGAGCSIPAAVAAHAAVATVAGDARIKSFLLSTHCGTLTNSSVGGGGAFTALIQFQLPPFELDATAQASFKIGANLHRCRRQQRCRRDGHGPGGFAHHHRVWILEGVLLPVEGDA